MLYNERKRLRKIEEREARGESFWTEAFVPEVRMKLLYAFVDASLGYGPIGAQAYRLLLRSFGRDYLAGTGLNDAADLDTYVRSGPDSEMPSVIEAMLAAIKDHSSNGYHTRALSGKAPSVFESEVQQLLLHHRVSYEFVDGEMVPFASRELHQAVLEPTLQLLRGAKYTRAELAYRHALGELSNGKPGDAITDAATALQELLVALGCKGDSLGPLLKSAMNIGLLAAHDVRLTEALQKAIEWVSADRSNLGDAHKADSAVVDDAWFAVHIVGAIMVRLVGPPRGARK